MKARDRVEILLEQQESKLDAILEYVAEIPDIKRRVVKLEDGVSNLEADMKVVKAVLRVHSDEIADLYRRIGPIIT